MIAEKEKQYIIIAFILNKCQTDHWIQNIYYSKGGGVGGGHEQSSILLISGIFKLFLNVHKNTLKVILLWKCQYIFNKLSCFFLLLDFKVFSELYVF